MYLCVDHLFAAPNYKQPKHKFLHFFERNNLRFDAEMEFFQSQRHHVCYYNTNE